MFLCGREQKLRYWLRHRLNSINGGTYENYLLLPLFCSIRSANLLALQFRTVQDIHSTQYTKLCLYFFLVTFLMLKLEPAEKCFSHIFHAKCEILANFGGTIYLWIVSGPWRNFEWPSNIKEKNRDWYYLHDTWYTICCVFLKQESE